MKGRFPRDCLVSAYLHLLARRSHNRTVTRVTRSVLSALSAYIEFILLFFLNLMVILCLNIYLQFVASGSQTL